MRLRQWLAPLLIEKHLKPSVNSNSMDEDRNRKDAALSHSDGGPLRHVRDPGGLESEGLTLRSGSVLKGRTLHMSQISHPQALTESSAVTAQGQAVLVKAKASQPLHMQSAQRRRTLHSILASVTNRSNLDVSHQVLFAVSETCSS